MKTDGEDTDKKKGKVNEEVTAKAVEAIRMEAYHWGKEDVNNGIELSKSCYWGCARTCRFLGARRNVECSLQVHITK